ncbi:hypothetical protein [Nocardia australiensis]|uniref:hypothetical protein n=1 Tax=Nocardia australiensis TaxID=2887191 RepID=UPI001D15AADF|nr:hypothetical protein [Nocardia australiensis]
MARSRSAALISTPEAEFAEIIAWYEEQLRTTAPPVDLEWEPVKIGPTWQWENGWVLPELTLGWRVLAWCGKWLRDKHGHPWQFTPEQTRFVLWFFAVDETGDFLYHSAVLQRLKGWGKDPIASCLGMAGCFAEVTFDHWKRGRPIGREEPSAWVQIIAVSQEQTKNTMKLFPSLVPAETRAYYGIQIGKLNVYGLGDTRQIEAVTSSPLAIEGGRPTLVIRAETQNWNSSNGGHDMAGALEGNAAKSERGAARMLDICNAYRPGEDSVGERAREAYDATVGANPTTVDFGLLYDSLEAPPDAPLTAEAAPAVVHSIAGDSYWLDTRPNGRIVKSILNPANPPSESRRKWFNQITAAADAWLTPQAWDLLGTPPTPVPADEERVVLFFDGSKSDDATALIGCHIDTGAVFHVGVWQRPAGWDSKRRWLVDRDDVDHRVREACEKWDALGLWVDPSDARDDETGERFWEPLADEWARIQTWELPAVKTGDFAHPVIWDMRNPRHLKLFTEAAERFTTDVTGQSFRHDGHKVLAKHVHNARRRPNKFGVGLGKEHRESARKIDAAVAAVGARMMRQMWLAIPRQEMTYEAMFV